MRTSDELREGFLDFFVSRGHVRRPSASLVPATYDPSVLLTTAGMQQFKPIFLGMEPPPGPRGDDRPEVLPDDRHRFGRAHRADT